MDRNYYYRTLGVRPDATPKQIKAAYEARIARLSSADFADEPEYARRKKEQATKAYKVLMGVSPAATKDQKESRFERFKDKIESREGFEKDDFEDEGKKKIKISLPEINFGKRTVKTAGSKGKFVVVTTVVTMLIAVIGMISAIGGLVSDNSYDYEEFYYVEEVQNAQDLIAIFDYYQKLDSQTALENRNNIDWSVGSGEYGQDPLSGDMMDVLYWLDIYDIDGFFTYITGDENYYMESDDYLCAVALIDWLEAPPFEAIAGQTNLYTGEPILSLADYMEYLEEFVYEHV